MKRLVYSPSVNVWIKSDSGVFDLSPYVTSVQIDRRIGATSYARVKFRNPRVSDENNSGQVRSMFTESASSDGSIRPMFHPMDPITITMTRIKGRPVQVFSGYCDTTPHVQLLPGIVAIDASCTIKRLQYTYWDPALPFIRGFMLAHGWGTGPDGLTLSPENEARKTAGLNDTSIGNLLYSVLTEVGGWSPDNVYIEKLPGEQISTIVKKLYDDITKENASSIKEFHEFLTNLIGSSKYGNSTYANGGNTSNTAGEGNKDTSVKNVGKDWVSLINHYSNGRYNSEQVYRKALTNGSNGGNPNDRNIVAEKAKKWKVPFSVLWGIYGHESGFGKDKGSYEKMPNFGLTYKYPGNTNLGPIKSRYIGTSGDFVTDAEEVAKSIHDLYKKYNGKEPQN
jgi:hypothetical protein